MTDHAFEIDGKGYELPLPSTFDIDEAQIYFDYTGVVLEEMWLEGLGWDQLKTRPGFIPALAHVAYRRGNPDTPNDQIRIVIGKQNRAALVGTWLASVTDTEEEAADEGKAPAAASGEPTSSSPTSSATGSTPNGTSTTESSSGETSRTSSDPPDDEPGTTGITGSDGRPTHSRLKQVV